MVVPGSDRKCEKTQLHNSNPNSTHRPFPLFQAENTPTALHRCPERRPASGERRLRLVGGSLDVLQRRSGERRSEDTASPPHWTKPSGRTSSYQAAQVDQLDIKHTSTIPKHPTWAGRTPDASFVHHRGPRTLVFHPGAPTGHPPHRAGLLQSGPMLSGRFRRTVSQAAVDQERLTTYIHCDARTQSSPT